MLAQKSREGAWRRGGVLGGRGGVRLSSPYSGGKGSGLRGSVTGVRGIEDVRGRESTTTCQFPLGLLSSISASSISASSKRSYAICNRGIALSLLYRGGFCASFTVSDENGENSPKGTVSSVSLLTA